MTERIAAHAGPVDTVVRQADRQRDRWRGDPAVSDVAGPTDAPREVRRRRLGPGETAVMPRPPVSDTSTNNVETGDSATGTGNRE